MERPSPRGVDPGARVEIGPRASRQDDLPLSIGDPRVDPTIADIVDAMMLLDEPMLNSRYHGLLIRLGSDDARQRLSLLPRLVAKSLHLSRRGSYEWMRTGLPAEAAGLRARSERVLIESFLAMNEQQIRLITFLARSAPTAEVRAYFDEMADLHRQVSGTLRSVLKESGSSGSDEASEPRSSTPYRGVQEESELGDLRGQLEAAIRGARSSGRPVRTILLSHTALRHLRDQGCFADGDTFHMGVPVAVDLAWDVSAFSLLSFEIVPLDEIFESNQGGPGPSRKGAG